MKKIIPVIIILISAIFLTLTYLNKPFNNNSIKLTSHNNQNVQNYAEKNNFNYQNISDSELNELKNNDNFTYNIKNNQIEVTGYKGSENQIIIPETIENLPVTIISMNLDKMPSEIYIPSSVITINQIIDENINNNFYLTIIIELIALIITLLVILILNKKKNQDKTVYITFLYILSIIYLFAINMYAYLNINNLLTITIVTTIIYFILFLPLYFVKNRLKEYDKKVNNIQTFTEEALNIAKKINNQDLIESLKFSDPVSSEFTKEIENTILEKLNKTVKTKDDENINEIINLIIERNNICKKTKGKY